MKRQSAMAKGKRMESFVLDYVRENIDANAYTPKGSGNGLEKGDIYIPSHQLVIEVKNQAHIKLIDWWAQTEEQAHNQIPMLAIRHPKYGEGKKTLAVMFFEDVCDLLQKQEENPVTVEKYAPYEVRDALTKLETALKALKRNYKL